MFSSPSWIKTTLGTSVELWASHSLGELKGLRPILVMGGIHGDEPEGVRLASDLLQWLKSHTVAVTASTATSTSTLNQSQSQSQNSGGKVAVTPWILIPCLNVDGYAKNTRVNGRGVDLNRNYPSKDWSKEAKAERYFPGTGPGSEVEIRGIVGLIETYRPRLVIHCHSWKPCIVGTGPFSKRDAERLGRSSGYEVVDEIGYPTPGSLSRYGWHDKQIPVICIEEQDHLSDLSPIWPRFAKGFEEIFTDQNLRGGS